MCLDNARMFENLFYYIYNKIIKYILIRGGKFAPRMCAWAVSPKCSYTNKSTIAFAGVALAAANYLHHK